ncbi:hypothetical protein K4K54_010788 [Colletotrichum sp. SAR 10_86]|nr:hypothetical protein K4K54_010788 [Colletotrichum sp. SAR 10_86]
MTNPIPPLITLEEHFVSQDNFNALSELYAEQLRHLPEVADQLLDVSRLRLASMDKSGISFQVVSHAPGLGPKPARYSSLANDELARAVKARPERFAAFAVLPMAEPQAAAAELRRCVGMGFVGALVDAHVDGVHYDDRRFWPVFEAAADLDVPLYLHPTYPTPAQSSAYEGQYEQGAARSLGSSGFGWHQETGYPPGVRVREIDYDSIDSLREALRGIDAVISTVGKRNGLESQFRLIDAAVMEGVTRFIPSEFGADLQHKEIRTFPTYQTKIEVEEYLEKKARETNLTYTFIYCSALFDEGLDLGAFADFQAKKVNFFDGGATTFNATRSVTVADAVVAILNKLEATKNKAVRIRDVSMAPKELLKVIQGLDKNADWTSVAIDTGKLVQGAQVELASGKFSPKAFAAFAMRATFAPGLAGQYGDDNDLLGIKDIAKDDLENALKSRLLV